jgi:hypothetical protein
VLWDRVRGTFKRQKIQGNAVGTWDTTINFMDIPYYTEIKILGFSTTRTVKQSAYNSRLKVTGRVRTQECEAYCRDLCLSQRILYVHAFLGESLVHGTNPPRPRRMCATAKLSDILVLMARRNMPGPPLDTPTAEGTLGMGPHRHRSQESRPTNRRPEVPGTKIGKAHGRVVT